MPGRAGELDIDYAAAVARVERMLLPLFDSGVRAGSLTSLPKPRQSVRSIGSSASIAKAKSSRRVTDLAALKAEGLQGTIRMWVIINRELP